MSRPETKTYGIRKMPVIVYSIAYLNSFTKGYLDLNKIWQRQCLSESLQWFMDRLCDSINEKIYTVLKSSRVSTLSYARKKETYDLIKSSNFGLKISSIIDDLLENI